MQIKWYEYLFNMSHALVEDRKTEKKVNSYKVKKEPFTVKAKSSLPLIFGSNGLRCLPKHGSG